MKEEADEWLDELVRSWVEVYKKSLTTLELMRIVNQLTPVSATDIGQRFTQTTGWGLTGQALYRTLRRLTKLGLLHIDEVAVQRTGAKRKDYALTALGHLYLERIEQVVGRSY